MTKWIEALRSETVLSIWVILSALSTLSTFFSLRRPDLGERPTLPDFSVIAKDIAVGTVPHAPKNG
jgi:hypothetical protein